MALGGAPWARAANFVKKPPLIVNVTYLELNGFNAPMWVSEKNRVDFTGRLKFSNQGAD